MSVPLPAPDGPVMTITGSWRPPVLPFGALLIEETNKLRPLPIRQTADRLRFGDPALVEIALGLHLSELRDSHEHVENLGGGDVVRRVAKDGLEADASQLEVLLELRALHADVVGPPESVHALVE